MPRCARRYYNEVQTMKSEAAAAEIALALGGVALESAETKHSTKKPKGRGGPRGRGAE